MADIPLKEGKPLPGCKAILLYERTMVEPQTRKVSLIGLIRTLTIEEYPGQSERMKLFLQLVDGIGEYDISIFRPTFSCICGEVSGSYNWRNEFFFYASLRQSSLGFFKAKRILSSGPAGRVMKSAGLQIAKNETRFQFTLLPGTETICAFQGCGRSPR